MVEGRGEWGVFVRELLLSVPVSIRLTTGGQLDVKLDTDDEGDNTLRPNECFGQWLEAMPMLYDEEAKRSFVCELVPV